jgi:hypothetical protein
MHRGNLGRLDFRSKPEYVKAERLTVTVESATGILLFLRKADISIPMYACCGYYAAASITSMVITADQGLEMRSIPKY